MGRKPKYPEHPVAGRPPKHPLEKVGRPVRALVTLPVMDALESAMLSAQVNLSETLRLALYRHLECQGLMTDTLRNDPTWDTLRQKGLI